MCVSKFLTQSHINLQSEDMDSKSVELRFMSVRVGLGVPPFIFTKPFRLLNHQKIKFVKSFNNYNNHLNEK